MLSDVLCRIFEGFAGLQRSREDQVATKLISDLEGACAGLYEAIAVVEGYGAQVSGVRAQQQPPGTERPGVRDRSVHEGLGGAKVGDGLTASVRTAIRRRG